jgi:uncharacterized Zn-binding protein involved in type VI secretion
VSGQPAARVGDLIMCTMPQTVPSPPPPPHGPAPIQLPGEPSVLIGGQFAARMGDQSLCVSPAPMPNPIVRGAMPVPIGKMPAARKTDKGTHAGPGGPSEITGPCEKSVEIGLSGTTGNPYAGNKQCLNMAAGRNPPPGSTAPNGNPLAPNTPGQSYNNCGVESSRQLISQATGSNISQEGLLNQAISSGVASQPAIGSTVGTTTVTAANQAWFSGGTNTTGLSNLLTSNGVPATPTAVAPGGAPALGDIEVALSQGRGVIAPVDVQGLPGWGTQTGGHAVVVTGVEYDDNGNITKVIYNDTGIGVCQQSATPAQFQGAMNNLAAQQNANGFTPMGFAVTNNPVW